MINEETKAKTLGRLRRIEGQVQGLQRMIDGEAYCVDILLQVSAGLVALAQAGKLMLGRHDNQFRAAALLPHPPKVRHKNNNPLHFLISTILLYTRDTGPPR